jgi:hypothetical protein
MHHFTYRDGAMCAEDVELSAIARAVGTPFYCYSSATIERHYRVFSEAFAELPALVCYAMKANSNQGVLGRRIAASASRGRSGAKDHILRGRQDASGNGARPRRGHFVFQRRVRTRT